MSQTTPPRSVMPMITVESVDDIRSFYVDVLGFDHLMGVVGKDGQFDFCTVDKDGARLMFTRSAGPTATARRSATKQPVEIYFGVVDVDRYFAELGDKGGVTITDALTTQWWGDRTFKVIDPYGFEIWFYQTVGEPKPPQGAKIV